MQDHGIKKRYGNALFKLIKNDDAVTECVIAILANISDVCQDPGIRNVLQSPVIPSHVKRDVLGAIAEKTQAPDVLRNFFNTLIDAGRADALVGLDTVLRSLYYDKKGILEAELTTVIPLDEQELNHISQVFAEKFKKKVIINQHVDKSILGGVRLKIRNKLLDLSLKTKLDEIAQSAVF